MSEFTRTNLGNHCYSQFSKNLNNYNVLAKSLNTLINVEDNIPSGFPIKVKERDALQKTLADKYRIYCPVHWRVSNNKLSQEILTLPCDYRYNEDHMEYILHVFKKLSINTLRKK